MDKNGLLLQVIAARGANPDKKVIIWVDAHGPICNDCAEGWCSGEKPYAIPRGKEYPKLTFLGDQIHPREAGFVCILCGEFLKDHA